MGEKDFDTDGLTEEEIALLSEESEPEQEPEKSEETTGETPEQEPTKEPEAQPEQQNKAADPERPEGFVPHQAMHAERLRARAAEDKVKELNDKFAVIAERLTAPQQQVEQQIDPQLDPFGAQQAEIAELKQFKQNYEQQQQHAQQQQHIQQQQQAVFNDVTNEYNQAVASDPTIEQAYMALQDSVVKQGQAHGLVGQQLNAHVVGNIRQAALYARQQGFPIGQYIKSLAGSIGWVPDASTDEKDPAEAQIDKLSAAQAANKSLTGKGAGAAEMSLERLAAMSGSELEKFVAENEDVVNKLMA